MHKAITTVWTTFRLGIVCLLVPEETRLRWQHLAAMANVLLLPDDLLAVPLAMLCQIRVTLEVFAAHFALERRVSGVHAHVLHQCATHHKLLVTHITTKLLPAQVAFQM